MSTKAVQSYRENSDMPFMQSLSSPLNREETSGKQVTNLLKPVKNQKTSKRKASKPKFEL